MHARMQNHRNELPGAFDALARLMPPMAIQDDVQHGNTIEMIDRLMQIRAPTRGQRIYLETLVELVEAYESRQHSFDHAELSGHAMLRYVLSESGMNASDLARLLDVHASLGSKILKGERSLTWPHAKRLAGHFRLQPALFMD